MLAVLSITFPIFAIVALGFGLVRMGVFAQADMAVLGRFALNIALPALLFTAVAGNPFALVFDPGYLAVYTGATLTVLVIAFGWFTARGLDRSRVGVAVLGASMPNSGFVGYPILLFAHEAVATRVLALNMIVENLLIIPLCLILMERDDANRARPLTVFAARVLLALVRRPMVMAILLGLVVSVSGIALPDAAMRLARLLANAMAPLALFFVGGTLAGLTIRGNRAVAAEITAARLVLHPALAAIWVGLVPLVGLAAPAGEMRAAVILSAAMPMIGIYPVLAAEKGHGGMASVAVLGGTILSFFTLSALLLMLG